MKQHITASGLFILTVSGIVGSLVGCSPEQTFTPPSGGVGQGGGGQAATSADQTTGGQQYPEGSGGTSAAATTQQAQGGAATGGASTGAATGGAAVGGASTGAATGGKTSASTGGTKATTGGTKATTSSTKVATGGKQATGGVATSDGGSDTATGGAPPVTTTAAPNSGTTVTFSTSGKASGAMSGWGYVAMGATDKVSSPTCGADKTEITKAAPCNSTTNWEGTGLCVTGSVPIADAPDYLSWGLSVGVGASATKGEGLGQSLTSVTITVSGTPKTGLRAQVHRAGDPDGTAYCAALTSGTAIKFTSFATDCWADPPTDPLAAADVTKIDKIAVQVPAGDAAITVSNLCITGITFAK
jgi:hypothetical protein